MMPCVELLTSARVSPHPDYPVLDTDFPPLRKRQISLRLEIEPATQVDRHIQRLDADLARYEDSLVIGLRDGTLPSHDAPSAMRKSPPGPTTSLGAIALGEKDAYDDPAAAAAASPTGAATGKGGGRMTTGSPHSAAAAAARTTRKKPARSAQDLEKEREWKRRKELVREERQRKKRQDLEASGMPGAFLRWMDFSLFRDRVEDLRSFF